MPLVKKLVPLKLGSVGLDTSDDPKITDQALLRADNVAWRRGGTLSKRPGTKALTGAETNSWITRYKDRPVILEDTLDVIDGVDPTVGTLQAVATTPSWMASLARMPIPEHEDFYDAEIVEEGEVRAVVYHVVNGGAGTWDMHLVTYERNNGRLLDHPAPVAFGYWGTHARLVVSAGRIWLIWAEVAAIWVRPIDTATGVIGAAINTGLAVANGAPLDAVVIDSTWVMVATRNAAANALVLARLNLGALGFPAIISPLNLFLGLDAICIMRHPDGGGAGVDAALTAFYCQTTHDLWVMGYTPAGVNTIPATLVRNLGADYCVGISGVCSTPADATILETEGDAAHRDRVVRIYCDLPALVAVTAGVVIRKSAVASRPWVKNGTVYAVINYANAPAALMQRCSFVITEHGVPCGNILQGAVQTPYCPAVTDAQYVPTTLRETYNAWRTTIREYLNVDTHGPLAATLGRPDPVKCIEAQDVLLIPGSMPSLWDGVAIAEQGYMHSPEPPTLTSGGAGGALGVGTYGALVSYQWRDAYGRLHEISSSPVTVAVLAAQLITYYVPMLCHTRRADVQISVYRTAVNGTTYYLLYSRQNDVTLDDFTLIDGTADPTILALETHYTTGGVLPNVAPPPTLITCEHQGRQFSVDAEHPETLVRYSAPFAARVGVEWPIGLQVLAPPDGGAITALVSYQDRLLVAKRDRIYAFTGSGLTATGTGTGYSGPYLVSEAIGMQDCKNVVPSPGGLLFMGRRLVHVMDSAGTVAPMGGPVRWYTDPLDGLAQPLRGAAHLPGQSVVVFFAEGACLAYNYQEKLWSRWMNHPAKDGVEVGGVLWMLTMGGAVRMQDLTHHRDGAAAVPLAIETGWISLSGLLAAQRIYKILLIGQNLEQENLNLYIAYDHDPRWVDHVVFDTASLAAFSYAEHLGTMTGAFIDEALILEAQPSRQRCSAIRLRIWESSLAGTREGCEITGLALLVGLKDTQHRIGPARRMT